MINLNRDSADVDVFNKIKIPNNKLISMTKILTFKLD